MELPIPALFHSLLHLIAGDEGDVGAVHLGSKQVVALLGGDTTPGGAVDLIQFLELSVKMTDFEGATRSRLEKVETVHASSLHT